MVLLWQEIGLKNFQGSFQFCELLDLVKDYTKVNKMKLVISSGAVGQDKIRWASRIADFFLVMAIPKYLETGVLLRSTGVFFSFQSR